MEPTQADLQDAYTSLSKYRDRLRDELLNISKKLRFSPKGMEKTLENHNELRQVEEILVRLKKQLISNSNS